MTVYLKLTTKYWVDGDYTGTAANGISGTLYSDEAMSTVKDWSAYTVKGIRFLDHGVEYDSDETSALTINANGTFTYAPPSGKLNTVGLYDVQIYVESDTEQLSTVSLEGFGRLLVQDSG